MIPHARITLLAGALAACLSTPVFAAPLQFENPAGQNQNRAQQDLAQLCGGQKSPVGNLPTDRIRDSLRLSDQQNADLQELDQASAKAADILNASCPTEPTLTPTGRVAAMEQRLKAMMQAIETVRPALTKFYGSLSDEQKARFDRLGARPA